MGGFEMQWKKCGTAAMAVLLVGLVAFLGCTGAQKGAAIGGIAGTATGVAVGGGKGAVIGGVVGTAAGAIIGDYMSKQKKELEKVPGADVQQVGDELVVTFQSPILFDTDSSVLKPEARTLLNDIAGVLQKYPDTDVIVKGHTDDTGSEAHNQQLSERRAQSVRNYLVTLNVSAARLNALGFGETMPVASNSSADGRTQNRRVELQIAANEELRARSEDAASQPR
jgi:outer membrane protein OmpA-like peptidoglycan-associated protein